METALKRSRRKAAVGAGDHVVAADQTGQANNAISHEPRMLDQIGVVADDARH
jgi:hypothetical protein